MNLKTFYDDYNLKELEVLKLFSKDNKLYILIEFNASLDLIANGCRPVFDLTFKHMFIFEDFYEKIRLRRPIRIIKYEFIDNSLLIIANNKEIIINSKNIEVIRNYKE